MSLIFADTLFQLSFILTLHFVVNREQAQLCAPSSILFNHAIQKLAGYS
jgi:hypothetical protein